MIRAFDSAAVVGHARYRALGAGAQAAYLRLLGAADAGGHVDHAAVERVDLERAGRAALAELVRAGLLDEEPSEIPGWWVVLPWVLDDAAVFESGGGT